LRSGNPALIKIVHRRRSAYGIISRVDRLATRQQRHSICRAAVILQCAQIGSSVVQRTVGSAETAGRAGVQVVATIAKRTAECSALGSSATTRVACDDGVF
jgi:hypothetical protein